MGLPRHLALPVFAGAALSVSRESAWSWVLGRALFLPGPPHQALGQPLRRYWKRAEQTFGTVVSLESSTCCSNDPSFHWKFSESDLSEGAGSDECSENASQSFLEAPAVGVFTLLCLEKGF